MKSVRQDKLKHLDIFTDDMNCGVVWLYIEGKDKKSMVAVLKNRNAPSYQKPVFMNPFGDSSGGIEYLYVGNLADIVEQTVKNFVDKK